MSKALEEATRISDKDDLAKHEAELVRRGVTGDGPGKYDVSVDFPGVMLVEVDGHEGIPHAGSFSGNFSKSVTIRPVGEKALEKKKAA